MNYVGDPEVTGCSIELWMAGQRVVEVLEHVQAAAVALETLALMVYDEEGAAVVRDGRRAISGLVGLVRAGIITPQGWRESDDASPNCGWTRDVHQTAASGAGEVGL